MGVLEAGFVRSQDVGMLSLVPKSESPGATIFCVLASYTKTNAGLLGMTIQ